MIKSPRCPTRPVPPNRVPDQHQTRRAWPTLTTLQKSHSMSLARGDTHRNNFCQYYCKIQRRMMVDFRVLDFRGAICPRECPESSNLLSMSKPPSQLWSKTQTNWSQRAMRINHTQL